MIKRFFLISWVFVGLLIAATALTPKAPDPAAKIKAIEKEVARIESDLPVYKRKHRKIMDCFGWDIYYDTTGIVKFHNYQSCFDINYYYQDARLILVTIDGSFLRTCGYTQANYCWNTEIPRNFKSRIYYHKGKILKESDEGARPCCPISPGGYVGDSIAFNNKAKLFLTEYGKTKELQSLIE